MSQPTPPSMGDEKLHYFSLLVARAHLAYTYRIVEALARVASGATSISDSEINELSTSDSCGNKDLDTIKHVIEHEGGHKALNIRIRYERHRGRVQEANKLQRLVEATQDFPRAEQERTRKEWEETWKRKHRWKM